MNIFLPYENDIIKSVQSLDLARLNKQILETQTLLNYALGVSNAYGSHPVAQFYKNNPNLLAYYGLCCCEEYIYRTNKEHSLQNYFNNYCADNLSIRVYTNYLDGVYIQPEFTPYYMEGSKNTPECIRTTKFVSELFQAKLIKKWLNDKHTPNFGNRGKPDFFEKYLGLSKEEQDKYWQEIEQIKCEVRDES